jgi:hypothetical protein
MKISNGFAPDNSNISTHQYIAHNSGKIAPNVLPPQTVSKVVEKNIFLI